MTCNGCGAKKAEGECSYCGAGRPVLRSPGLELTEDQILTWVSKAIWGVAIEALPSLAYLPQIGVIVIFTGLIALPIYYFVHDTPSVQEIDRKWGLALDKADRGASATVVTGDEWKQLKANIEKASKTNGRASFTASYY